jgi:hypothetical protein
MFQNSFHSGNIQRETWFNLSFPDLEAKKTLPFKMKPELFLGPALLPPERKYGNSGKRAVPTDHDLQNSFKKAPPLQGSGDELKASH